MEIIDIDFACKRSRFSEARFIHVFLLYCRKIRQHKEKTTIKITDKLNKTEDKIPKASADANTMMNTAETTSILT
jgi:hypothetical protein